MMGEAAYTRMLREQHLLPYDAAGLWTYARSEFDATVRQLEALVGRKAAFRFDRGNKRFDAPIAHRDCVALEDAAGGLDRDGPARPDQETVRVNSLECISYFGLTSAFP